MSDRLLPEGLLEIMQCPVCGGKLEEVVEASVLRCLQCGRTYPVADEIPNMLVDDAAAADD